MEIQLIDWRNYILLKEFDKKFNTILVGVDEAGRGPLAGPVVSAAVIVKDESKLDKVKDSKKLTEKKREELYETILKNCYVGLGLVDAEEIDKKNILIATMESMKLAIQNLNREFSLILVDGNMKIPNLDKKQIPIVKGDNKSLAIASASIVAKVTRDRIMINYDKEYPKYNFKKHKGYGTKEHMDNIKKFGISKIHRRSFLKKYVD